MASITRALIMLYRLLEPIANLLSLIILDNLYECRCFRIILPSNKTVTPIYIEPCKATGVAISIHRIACNKEPCKASGLAIFYSQDRLQQQQHQHP